MFDPFDSSSIQSAYGGTRFTGGQGEEQDAMADFADSYMQGRMGIQAAARSGKLRIDAAKRALQYRKQQQKPSTGQKIASGIGVAASAAGAVSAGISIAAAI
jgi:hypothetical protein